MQALFERRQELAPGIWQFYFRPERSVDFVPGQYLSVILPTVKHDPRGAGRVLTLTSLPSDPFVSFIVKYLEPHSPHKQALFNLQLGDRTELTDAMGDLILPKDPRIPLVFIAGGIGIASYISMVSWLIQKKEERSIFLFYALRSMKDQIYRELFTSYPLMLHTLIVKPNRLTARQIRDTTPPNALLYISGSQTFVDGLFRDLQKLGVPRERIAFDYFEGYTENTI